MNYKCSAQARLVLDQVTSKCQQDTKTNNRWSGKSGSYMYIMGRENADGKATGVVHKFASDGSHKLAGSFKILVDGTVTRWTGLPKSILSKFTNQAIEEYKKSLVSQPTNTTESVRQAV